MTKEAQKASDKVLEIGTPLKGKAYYDFLCEVIGVLEGYQEAYEEENPEEVE